MCAMSNNSKRCSSVVALVALVLAICVWGQQAQGQFFTKSSSKSIPRMGRRSIVDNAPEAKAEAFRRSLIDRLVDEYGASLFTNLLESKLVQQNSAPMVAKNELTATGASSGTSAGAGELYLRNEQPFDQLIRPTDEQQLESSMSRSERGAAADQTYNKQSSKSLAMRAFNADRLLQHLASGGSPATIGFYDRLTEAKEHSNYGD